MCFKCNDLLECATRILDDVMHCRKEHCGGYPSSAQNTAAIARVLIESVEPQGVQYNETVQNICLGFAAAVERLVALEQCGVIT